MNVEPFCVQAWVNNGVSLPFGYLHLDALLAYSVCLEKGIPMAYMESELVPVQIPVAQSCGFHMLSASEVKWAEMGMRYTQRRFPIEHAQGMSMMKRVQVTAGPCKSFRTPYEYNLPDGPMTWWGLGDISEVTRLLSRITHLGKKRSVGNGNVNAWDVRRVDESECWEGFPVMRDGFPLRHLPLDFPGVNPEATRRIGCLTYPYWLTSAEQEVYAPA